MDKPRNLVVCCDGTWNTPDQKIGGLPAPTNVVKIFNACIEDIMQLKYYHPGVGTDGSKLNRFLGGGIGLGIDKNIQSAYHWLSCNYKPGDQIFIFGFSRGAFTARSLASFILTCGLLDLTDQHLPDRDAWSRVTSAYEQGYREKQSIIQMKKGWPLLKDNSGNDPDIHFVGVWDTVGSLGVPDDMVLLDQFIDDPRKYRFHDTNLSNRIKHAYHAVALDERRASFSPTLWKAEVGRQEGTFHQLWFAGTHGDVGGGHVECGLSDIALEWMCNNAVANGLLLDQHLLDQLNPDFQAVMHDGIDGIWKLMRTLPRAVPKIANENVGNVLHNSAYNRHQLPPIMQAPYRPTFCIEEPNSSWRGKIFASQHWCYTGLWLDAGVQYTFEASGEWIDLVNRAGPKGINEHQFQIGTLAYRVGDLFALLEKGYQRLTGKTQADWWATRRYENAPWFALVGMIANQEDVLDDGTPRGQTFLIGNNATVIAERSGYLYCYANDAWDFYNNNRGSVKLCVSRSTELG